VLLLPSCTSTVPRWKWFGFEEILPATLAGSPHHDLFWRGDAPDDPPPHRRPGCALRSLPSSPPSPPAQGTATCAASQNCCKVNASIWTPNLPFRSYHSVLILPFFELTTYLYYSLNCRTHPHCTAFVAAIKNPLRTWLIPPPPPAFQEIHMPTLLK
jgi:hypothetical protein